MQLFFDTLIFGFLILDAGLIVFLILTAKGGLKILHYALAALALFAWGVIFYGSFISIELITIKHEAANLSTRTNHSMKFAVISDLHAGPYKDSEFFSKVADRIIEENPDAVLLLGDFIFDEQDTTSSLDPFKELANRYPVYAVLGNHDFDIRKPNGPIDYELGESVSKNLQALGITVLSNSGLPVNTDGLYLAGIKELWTNEANLAQSLENRLHEKQPTILIAHNPDIATTLTTEHPVGLILSGHTHGGHIRLPLIGPIGVIPTELGQEFDKGWFEINDTSVYITSGIGESGPRARLFNRPEIIMMTVYY